MSRFCTTWTPEQDRIIRTAMIRGESFTIAGQRVGKSRNAVAGRVHRLFGGKAMAGMSEAAREQSAKLKRDMDQMADVMAEYDCGCIVAGRALGMTKNRSAQVFRKMKDKLGAQAV